MSKPFEIPPGVVGRADQLHAMIADLYKIVGAQFDAEDRGDIAESRTIAALLGYVIDQIPQADLKPLLVVLLGLSYDPSSHDSEEAPQ